MKRKVSNSSTAFNCIVQRPHVSNRYTYNQKTPSLTTYANAVYHHMPKHILLLQIGHKSLVFLYHLVCSIFYLLVCYGSFLLFLSRASRNDMSSAKVTARNWRMKNWYVSCCCQARNEPNPRAPDGGAEYARVVFELMFVSIYIVSMWFFGR